MSKEIKPKRRDFLFTATYTIGAVGLGAAVAPLRAEDGGCCDLTVLQAFVPPGCLWRQHLQT